MKTAGIWLAGAEQSGRGRPLQVYTPFTDTLLATVDTASAEDVANAVDAAHACFKSTMRLMPVHQRVKILLKAAELLAARAEDIARMLVAESGKPITLCRTEARRGTDILHLAAESAKFVTGEVVPLDALAGADERVGLAMRTPYGVVAALSPFNAPINLSLQKVAPALAAGCTVVLKPAEQTPLTVLELGRIFADAGLPPGALSILPGRAETGQALVAHPRVAVVSFTGSSAVAEKIQASIGIKKVIYELGSIAPNIVCVDADLDQAARSLVQASFNSSGQICVSAQRIYVHADVYDAFLARFLPLVDKLKIGDPMDETVALGSLINRDALARMESWVGEALAQGATLLTGGRVHDSGRNYMPTVLADVTTTMKVQCQEIFGPVVTVSRFTTDEEAIALANGTDYGLRAGVYTRDIKRAFRYARDLEVGAMSINDSSRFRQDNTPSAGVKRSGIGREGGRYAYEEYTYLKFVGINLA
jgi:acyl-CoA reductase-like NAD-dependent aldehyde dehydrogenase